MQIYYLRGTCTRTSCEYWHPPECQFFKKKKRVVRLETSVCFRITRLMNNQIKSKKRATSTPKREHDDKNAVAIVKSVSQLGCVSQESDALVLKGRKSWRSPTQEVLEPIQRVRFTESTLRQASIREKKGPSLGKIHVRNPHQRSPYAMTFEDRSQEETERQQRCARSKAWNLAKNICKLKENAPATETSNRNGLNQVLNIIRSCANVLGIGSWRCRSPVAAAAESWHEK